MKKAFLSAVLAAMAPAAYSQAYPTSCWVIENMSGTSLMKEDKYTPGRDGFTEPITLLLNGDNSSATGGSIRLRQVDPYMAIGLNKTNTFTTNESYLVDPDTGTALYTKTVSVNGVLDGITGARMFQGKARRCQ